MEILVFGVILLFYMGHLSATNLFLLSQEDIDIKQTS